MCPQAAKSIYAAARKKLSAHLRSRQQPEFPVCRGGPARQAITAEKFLARGQAAHPEREWALFRSFVIGQAYRISGNARAFRRARQAQIIVRGVVDIGRGVEQSAFDLEWRTCSAESLLHSNCRGPRPQIAGGSKARYRHGHI